MWLQELPDAEQMRATDRWAIEERGIPSLDLMERAGRGLADLAAEHFDVTPVPGTQAERLGDRLLGAEARRQVLTRPRARRGVLAFGGGEQPVREPRPAFERTLEPVDLEQVQADGHSTVTVLARLRG